MLRISLTQNQITVVSDEDFDLVGLDWCASLNVSYADGGRYTVMRSIYSSNGKKHSELLHRVIMERVLDRKLEPHELVDHIDREPLNNCRENLRLANKSQNGANRNMNKNNTSGYRGVSWAKGAKKWEAYICPNNRKISLGHFDSPIDAAKAYDKAAREYFGEFAVTNFVD